MCSSHAFIADARMALLAPIKPAQMVKLRCVIFQLTIWPSTFPCYSWHEWMLMRLWPCRQPVRLQQRSKRHPEESGIHRRRQTLQYAGTLHVSQDRCSSDCGWNSTLSAFIQHASQMRAAWQIACLNARRFNAQKYCRLPSFPHIQSYSFLPSCLQ
jgi:NADH:ubiquinone oxidoreductase subunit